MLNVNYLNKQLIYFFLGYFITNVTITITVRIT